MELLDLPQLAERAGLPLSTARYFRDRFLMFVPSVRVRGSVLHPPQAVETMQMIRDIAASGKNVAEIERLLSDQFPVTVVTAQPVTPETMGAGPAIPVEQMPAASVPQRPQASDVLDQGAERIREAVEELKLATLSLYVQRDSSEPAMLGDSGISSEIWMLRERMDLLQRQIEQTASKEQLDWIGDVVAAVALKPPSTLEPATMRQLDEITAAVKEPRPNADVAELRVAVERLAEQVNRRDSDFHGFMKTLTTVFRQEIQALHGAISVLKLEQPVDLEPAAIAEPVTPPARAEASISALTDPPVFDMPYISDASIALRRRLGQPLRPIEHPAETNQTPNA